LLLFLKDNEKKFYSKQTLITGEYILFLMAPKLCITNKKGQNLIIEDGNNNEII
jgi:hypothetical protein